MSRIITFVVAAATTFLSLTACAPATICPFCSALSMTLAQQMKSNDIIIIGKLLEIAEPIDDPDAELPRSVFEITQIIKGDTFVTKRMKFRTLLVGRYEVGQEFLVMGVDPPNVAWSTPMKTTKRITDYLTDVQSLPETGPDRLKFFQDFFEDEESVLAFDAYDEFAGASYDDLQALKTDMDRPRLVNWIKDLEKSPVRRRLYFTMLGICGTDEDVKMMEGFIRSGDKKQLAGLDALIASYLTLKGEDGIPLIEDTFLRDKNVEYVDTLAAISALRFHGTEASLIPKDKIVVAMRLLLERPKMADMIIPDLARLKDWSVMKKLVQMFKDADDDTNWIRVPVITYLRACPKPEAKKYIAELEKIDPDAVRRANFFLDWDDSDDAEDVGKAFGDGDQEKGDDSSQSSDKTYPVSISRKGLQSPEPNDQPEACPLVEEDCGNDPASVAHTVLKPAVAEDASDSETPETMNNPAQPNVSNNIGSTVALPNETAQEMAPSLTNVAPIATQTPMNGIIWRIIFIPMACSLAIFVLLWSVFNGWFERLIF